MGATMSGTVPRLPGAMLSLASDYCRRLAGGFLRLARSFTQVPIEVRGSVIEAERETERFATIVRLGIVILIGGMFVALVVVTGRFAVYVAVIYALNLALSLLAMLMANRRIYRPWLPWALTTLDVIVFLAIIDLGPLGRSIPPSFTPALVGVWALFVLLALVSLRGSAILMVYATVLAAAGLGAHLFAQVVTSNEADAATNLASVFDPIRNAVRLALLISTGLVLAISAVRAKQTLIRAAALAREKTNLAKYLPAPMVELLAKRDLAELRRGRVQPVAVLFADIRGFTAMSERLSPTQVATLLNSFRDRATRAIEGRGGFVDKFIGDGVMGLFGLPEPGTADARAALLAAQDLLELTKRWSVERSHKGRQPVRVGVGVHFGTVFAGVLGPDERLEFTAIGDTVNAAERVEALTRELDVDLVVTEDALQAASEDGNGWQFIGRQPLRGRQSPVGLFTLRSPKA
jgi:adenylate cyclase